MKKLVILILLASFALSACRYLPIISTEKEMNRCNEVYQPY